MNSLLRNSPETWGADSTPRFPVHSSTRAARFRPRPRIGVALSIGGARGLAHVGVIQVLEENGIPVDAIAGVSMGAYVGGLWASGCKGAQLEELAAELRTARSLLSLVDLAFPFTRGLVHGRKVRRRLERTLGDKQFEDLATPFYVVAGNIRTLRRMVFNSGPIAPAIHASFAIPGICVPVEMDGQLYVDGGVVEPVPVPVLRQHANVDKVIAVSVVPTLEEVARSLPDPLIKFKGFKRFTNWLNRSWNIFATGNLVETLQRSLFCGQIRLAEEECSQADVVINPRIESPRWHDYHHWRDYVAAGRRAAEAALPAIRNLLHEPLAPPALMPAPAIPPCHENQPADQTMGLSLC